MEELIKNIGKFLPVEFILSFVGMVIAVVIVTQVLKMVVDYFNEESKSKIVALVVTMILMALATYLTGDFSSKESIVGVILWFIVNVAVVWYVATGLYDDILKKVLELIKKKLLGV